MAVTPRLGNRYPALSDTPDVPRDIQNLATDLDKAAIYSQGALASRPTSTVGTPGIQGRFYLQTDTSPNQLWLDVGTSWLNIGPITSFTLADGSVTTPKLADLAVTTAKLVDAAVTAIKILDGTITSAKLAAGLKPSGGAGAGTEALRALGTTAGTAAAGDDPRFAAIGSGAPAGPAGGALSGSYPNPGLANLAVLTAALNDLAVTTAKINDLAVTTAKLADSAVTGPKIADVTITAAKLVDGAVSAIKIAGSAVGTAALADNAVTTAKINDKAVTSAKIADALKPSAGAAAGTESLRALGTTAGTAAAGDDSRFSQIIPGSGTSLPGTPYDGQRFALRVTGAGGNDGYWDMMWDATLGYWKCMGGTPWLAARDDLDSLTTNTWTNSPADLALAVPFTGTYIVEFGAYIGNLAAGGHGRVGIQVNGVAPRESTVPFHWAGLNTDAGVEASLSKKVEIASVSASQVLRFQMRCTNAPQQCLFGGKYLSIIAARSS